MEMLNSPEVWMSLLTLTAMEIVLGIDNIIFISILTGRLPPEQREKGRMWGLAGAFITRLMLLATISWMVGLTAPLFTAFGTEITGKSLILFFGGLFLIYKATKEIHEKVEGDAHGPDNHLVGKTVTFGSVIAQIALLDLVFSLDSVITAVGMSQHIWVMVAANIIALAVMVLTAKSIGDFVQRHPTVKMLALSFLFMIGMVLVADGLGFHVPKGYIYAAMGFSVIVEFLNLRSKTKAERARAAAAAAKK